MASSIDRYNLIKEQITLECLGYESLQLQGQPRLLEEIFHKEEHQDALKLLEKELEEIKKKSRAEQIFYNVFQEGFRKRRRLEYYRVYEKRKKELADKVNVLGNASISQQFFNDSSHFHSQTFKRSVSRVSVTQRNGGNVSLFLLKYLSEIFKDCEKLPEFKALQTSLNPRRETDSLWIIFLNQLKTFFFGTEVPSVFDIALHDAKGALLAWAVQTLYQAQQSEGAINVLVEETFNEILEHYSKNILPENKENFNKNLEGYCGELIFLMKQYPQLRHIECSFFTSKKAMVLKSRKRPEQPENIEVPVMPISKNVQALDPQLKEAFEALSEGLITILTASKGYLTSDEDQEKLTKLQVKVIERLYISNGRDYLKSAGQIRIFYKEKSIKFHPDKNPDPLSTVLFQGLGSAKEFLEEGIKKRISRGDAFNNTVDLKDAIAKQREKLARLRKRLDEISEGISEFAKEREADRERWRKDLEEDEKRWRKDLEEDEKRWRKDREQRSKDLERLGKDQEQLGKKIELLTQTVNDKLKPVLPVLVFFAQEKGIPLSNALKQRQEIAKQEIEQVEKPILGFPRLEALNLLCNNLKKNSEIQRLLIPAVKEALLTKEFYGYLVEHQGIAPDVTYEQVGLTVEFYTTNISVLECYLKYHLKEGGGASVHPSIYQALAHLQGIEPQPSSKNEISPLKEEGYGFKH